jgi:hemerythrin HHE cation binding domain-containing protein
MITMEIPRSVQLEHAAIHAALVDATAAAEPVGAAARELARVLHPHFVREEEIALPPLGLLARLADGGDGTRISGPETTVVLTMTDALKRELPQMLEEHARIRTAVEELRRAAIAAHDTASERLASQLALHAQNEEEVLYPAAIVVGELIRVRARTSND